MSAVLTIPVAGRYFDQILAGTKPEEYRLRTPYWRKRLEGRSYRRVVLTRGYPKFGGVEGQTRLTLPWNGYSSKTVTHEFFGPDPVEVFAIRVAPVEEDYDNMLHALGRPKRHQKDCYRNYFCTAADGELAERFELLGWWDFGRRINDGQDAIYHVNGAGKQALAEWMDAHDGAAGNRPETGGQQ
jgi:hypothetical protein